MRKIFTSIKLCATLVAISLVTACATNNNQSTQGPLSIINPENTCRNYHNMFLSKNEKYTCKQEYSSGGFYVGEHMNEKRHGTGYREWPSGASFKGTWINGNMDRGVLKYEDGFTYEGFFVNNKEHGNGKLTDPTGKVISEGLFEFGQFIPESELAKRKQAEAIAEQRRRENEKAEESRRENEKRLKIAKEQSEKEKIAREGDGSRSDLLCKKYGLKPLTAQYAECRMQLEIQERQQAEQQRIYDQRLAEYERENERRRGEAIFLQGMDLLSKSSRRSSQPMAPMPEPPAMQRFDIFIKGKPPISCMSNLNIIDCR